MSESYPWGSQAPQARLSKLKLNLGKSQTARERYMEGHKTKLAEMDEAERQIKADIRACEGIVQKELAEEEGLKLSKLLSKIAGSGKVDIGALLADPDLETKLVALASAQGKSSDKRAGKAPTKPSSASEEAGSGDAGAASNAEVA